MTYKGRIQLQARNLELQRELQSREPGTGLPASGTLALPAPGTLGTHTGNVRRRTVSDLFHRQVSGKAYTTPRRRISLEFIPTVVVTGVNITNLSTEDKRRRSVRDITSPSIDPSDPNGVNSRWLGVTEDVQCNTCGQGLMSCPGHDGLIKFPADVKVYHPLQMNYIILVLRSVCRGCAEMLLSVDNQKAIGVEGLNLYDRLNVMAKHSEGIVNCPIAIESKVIIGIRDCIPNPNYLLTASVNTQKVMWRSRGDKSGQFELEIDEVFKVLSAISRETADRLGFTAPSHPKDMILESILVPPVCVRFPMKQGATRGSNGLTDKYVSIVKRVNDLDLIKGGSITGDGLRNLASAIKDLMVSPENLSGKMSSAQSYAYQNALNSKSGLIRGNVTAKRVALSARTVVTPEPNEESDEAGVPTILAGLLTVDETVNTLNKEAMTKLLISNKINHINNRVLRKTDQILKVGDIVTRHLQNGDWVLLNRQPSLHKESMMAFRVKIIPGYTFRLHLSATSPYNADFDGDEMNLHVPQTVEAMAELREIASIKACMMNAQANRPNVGLVYDAVVAAFLLTAPSTLVKETLFMDSLSMLRQPPVLSELKSRVERAGQLFKTGVRSEITITGDADVIPSENFKIEITPGSGFPEPKINISSLREVLSLSDFPRLVNTRAYIDADAIYSEESVLVRRVRFNLIDGTLGIITSDTGKFLLYSDVGSTRSTLSIIPGRFKIRTIKRNGSVVRSIFFAATPYQVDTRPDPSNLEFPPGASIAKTYIDQHGYSLALRDPGYKLIYTFL